METCPRCGSFAVLVDDEFRRFCPACVRLLSQPGESTGGDAVKMLKATGAVLRQIGWLAVGLELVFALPAAIGTGFGLPNWAATLATVVLGTFGEVLILGTWMRRHLQGHEHAPLQWALAVQAFFRAIAVNLITSFVASVGMLLCCVGLFLGGTLASAIPIALFERKGPIDATRLSWERSDGQRVALGVAYLVTSLPTTILSAIPGALIGFSVAMGRSFAHLEVITAAVVLLTAIANTLPRLFQAVAWLATRPLPQLPAPPSPDSADPGMGGAPPG